MRLDLRTGRILVLSSWSLCLLWLWVSGEDLRYLGPRTLWVVPFGGLTLAIATLSYAWLSRDARDERLALTRAQAGGLAALLVPALVAFTMAGSALGSLAASKKLTSRGIDVTRLNAHLGKSAADASFLELDVAARNDHYAAQSGIHAGTAIKLTGFVMTPSPRPGAALELARFYILCCVADAVPLKAGVEVSAGTPRYPKDKWLTVSGHVVRRGRAFAVRADRVSPASRPRDPYDYFLR